MTHPRHLCSIAISLGLMALPTLAQAQPAPTPTTQPTAPTAQPQPVPSAQPPPPPINTQPQPPPTSTQPPQAPTPPTSPPTPQPTLQPGPPTAYYPPPPSAYYPLPFASPRTLPYRADDPAPDGYRLETRLNRRLVIAGTAVLGGAYLVSLFTAGTILSADERESSSYSPLLVPVIGPFITLGTGRDVDLGDDNDRAGGLLLLFDGITQVTGLALLVAGLFTDQNIWIRNDIPQQRPNAKLSPELFVGPRSAALRLKF